MKHKLYEDFLPREQSLFDDIPLELFGEQNGHPIRLTNPEIRRMLRLANPSKDDVFYDLGSGFAQNLIIGAFEFRLKKCVGVEKEKTRFLIARDRVEKWIASKRISRNQIKIKRNSIEKLIGDKVPGVNLKEATIIYYGLDPSVPLEENESILDSLDQYGLQHGCKIMTHFYNGIFPRLKPTNISHPFYLYEYPFDLAESQAEWLRSVIRREKSVENVRANELWEELSHDYNIEGFSREEVRNIIARYKEPFSIEKGS